ncbi:hypothetical protein [Streptomyces sp. NPDC006527]|uniref:hypothetical protein n=1 Tax=Streptomyces sp. NPDC006527 TaxID=3364749 RepID=UPI003678148C
MLDRDLLQWASADSWAEALLIALDRVERIRAQTGDRMARQAIYWSPNRYARNGVGYWVISSYKRGGRYVGVHRAVART